MKPITIYWTEMVSNPAKVLIIFEEIGIPYQSSYVELEDVKGEKFASENPNGRVPAIFDPNTNITLGETGAIIKYIIETYDKEGKVTYSSAPENRLLQQWSSFEASGQGLHFGQATWFNFHHPEQIESAQACYYDEIKRVIGVLNHALSRRDWLVGDKCTYADLAFVIWNINIDYLMSAGPVPWSVAEYPNFKRWQETMLARDSVKKVNSVEHEILFSTSS